MQPARPVVEETRRNKGSKTARAIHGVAHAEGYAIDLMWDLMARFRSCAMPHEFYQEFMHVANEEAVHFEKWEHRLQQLGHPYGSLAVHEGLWDAANKTSHSLDARLSLVRSMR